MSDSHHVQAERAMNKPITLDDEERRLLDQEGFLVLEDFADAALVSAIRSRIAELFAQLGVRAGAEFKQEPGTDRLANFGRLR